MPQFKENHIMKFIDPKTGDSFKLSPDDIFCVSIRRSNGKLKPIYTGKNASKAFQTYHSLKVFKHDRKFLKIKRLNEPVEIEVYAVSGKEEKPKSFKGYSISPNFKKKTIQNISNVPETCFNQFKTDAELFLNENGKPMKMNKLIPLLMANFIDLSMEEKTQLINSAMKVLAKHKILSGGDNTREIEKFLKDNPSVNPNEFSPNGLDEELL